MRRWETIQEIVIDVCILKANHGKKLCPITATHPLELIHMDFLTIESGKTGNDDNILIVTDHFMVCAQAFITPSQTAQVVAQTLWDKFFMHYGFPEKILSNQGCNFESKLIAELCKLSKIKKLLTTPYRLHSRTEYSYFYFFVLVV